MFKKATINYSADELKAHLRAFMLQAITLGEESQQLAVEMEPFGCALKPVRGIWAADCALQAWTKALEDRVSSEFSEGTNAKLRLSHIEGLSFPTRVPDSESPDGKMRNLRRKWHDAEKSGLTEQVKVMDEFLETLDFKALRKGLLIEGGCLAATGKQEAANTIASFLNLVGRSRKPSVLSAKGLVFTVDFGGAARGMERHDFRDWVAQVSAEIRIAEEGTGIAGLSSALDSIAMDIMRVEVWKDISSGTQFGVAGLLSVTIFKNHSVFVMEASRAGALLSFVAMFATQQLHDIQTS